MADRDAAAGRKRGRADVAAAAAEAGNAINALPTEGELQQRARPDNLIEIIGGVEKTKRLNALAKFVGNIWKVIALVDSRHDFGDMSKDTYIKISNYIDFLRNFANNIQRLVLFGNEGDAIALAQRLTSICKGRIVMGGGPEDAFVEYSEIQMGIPLNPASADREIWNRIRNSDAPRAGEDWCVNSVASAGWDGGVPGQLIGNGFKKYIIPAQFTVIGNADASWNLANDQSADFKRFHKAAAEVLGWTTANNNPIPVIIDTTKTLHKFSYPYFLPTLPMESYADPSPTSSIDWPYVAIEVGGDTREYIINDVAHYTVSSPPESVKNITIEYRIWDGQGERPAPVAAYNFGGAGIKPNAIEVCKGNINEAIKEVVTMPDGLPRRAAEYQTIDGAAGVAQQIAMFDANCGIYTRLSYPPEQVTPERKNKIAIPFIAKRFGDQGQADACKMAKRHIIMRTRGVRKPAGRLNYKNEHVPIDMNGAIVAGPDQKIIATIENFVFWTYDRVAAIYAVSRGITTVLQTGDKTLIIYKKEGDNFGFNYTIGPPPEEGMPGAPYTAPTIAQFEVEIPFRSERDEVPDDRLGVPIQAGGGDYSMTIRGGHACTRSMLANGSIGRKDANCFYNNLRELCTPFGTLYDAFTLLDILSYYATINDRLGLRDMIYRIRSKKSLKLCIDQCIRNEPSIYEAFESWEGVSARDYITNIIQVAKELMLTIAYTIYYSLLGGGETQNAIIQEIDVLSRQIDSQADIDAAIRLLTRKDGDESDSIYKKIISLRPRPPSGIINDSITKTINKIRNIVIYSNRYIINMGGYDIPAVPNPVYGPVAADVVMDNGGVVRDMGEPDAEDGEPNVDMNDAAARINARKAKNNAIEADNSISEFIGNIPSPRPTGRYILQIEGVFIRYEGGITININGIMINIDGVSGVNPSLMMTMRGHIRERAVDLEENRIGSALYISRYGLDTPEPGQGGGSKNNGTPSFYDKWETAQMQDEFNVDAAHNLFYQFIYLLAMCENLYFSQRDSADNAYVYNSVPISCGGHTQITMAAFIERLVAEYNARKSNPVELAVFLKMFLHFPVLLMENNMEGLLIDIKEYVNVWFQYATIDAKGTDDTAVKVLFYKIKADTLAKAKTVQENLYGNDETVANYLYTVYPHGFFILAFNSIEKKEVEPVGIAEAAAVVANWHAPPIINNKSGKNKQNMRKNGPLRTTVKLARSHPPPASLLTRLLSISGAPAKPAPDNVAKGGPAKSAYGNVPMGENGYETEVGNLQPNLPKQRRVFAFGGKKRCTKKKGSKRRTIKINRRKIHTKKRAQKSKTRGRRGNKNK